MSETIVVPDNGNNNGWNSPLGLLALGGNNNSGFLGGNGLGADSRTLAKAEDNLYGGLPDTGLTFSNMDNRISVIVLSHTSSKAEFANTWLHEVLHCATHIATAVGLDLKGEAVAYVGGELARDMQPVAARLMCPTCKD